MGRSKKQIDTSTLLQLRAEGKSVKAISSQLGVSIATLSRRIAELEHSKGILTKYRELQGLQLTGLQFRILDAVTPERVEGATLTDLIRSFSILKKAEMSIQGVGAVRVKGLVQYLLEMEKMECQSASLNIVAGNRQVEVC